MDLTYSTAFLVVQALREQLVFMRLINESFGAKYSSLYFQLFDKLKRES
jgi:hypothetical protein